MKIKTKTRNNNELPINFCTTGNFKNLQKIKFIPSENSLKIKKPKKINNQSSLSNVSECQTIKRDEIAFKDELIKKLQKKIFFLENKVKFLEREKAKIKFKSRNESLNNILILKTEKSFSHKNFNQNNIINKVTIPLDKNLLKEKLSKRKNKLFELINVNKLIKKNNFTKSFYEQENNKDTILKYNNSNYSSNYNTRNNSCTNSEMKIKKKNIKLTNTNSFHKSMNSINSKSSKKNKNIKVKNKTNLNLNRKLNDIPKKGRIKQNTSLKIMMSSTNYSNTVSNSFKEENTNKKNNSILNNEVTTNDNNKITFNDLKIKLENIKNRTKKLLSIYSSVNIDKNNNNVNQKMKDKRKDSKYSHYIKILKMEKIK